MSEDQEQLLADEEVEVAIRLMSRGEHSVALDLLNASYRANPGDAFLSRLIARAEAAYVKSASSKLSADAVPVPTDKASDANDVDAEESFLLSLIDGKTDVRSILWLSPMRDVEVLQVLQRLIDGGLVEMTEAAAKPVGAARS